MGQGPQRDFLFLLEVSPTKLSLLGLRQSWPFTSFLLLLTFFSRVYLQRGPLPGFPTSSDLLGWVPASMQAWVAPVGAWLSSLGPGTGHYPALRSLFLTEA